MIGEDMRGIKTFAWLVWSSQEVYPSIVFEKEATNARKAVGNDRQSGSAH